MYALLMYLRFFFFFFTLHFYIFFSLFLSCLAVALCGWAAKADDSFVCFGAKPDKGFLDLKSRRIRKWEGDAKES